MTRPDMAPEVCGLLLTGGRSSRMGQDKAALAYAGRLQADIAWTRLTEVCPCAFVSARREQAHEPGRAGRPQIHDEVEGIGPAGGILAALRRRPDRAWLVLACDLPFVSAAVLRHLLAARDPARPATAFRSAHDGLPEPLCAVYEPAFAPLLESFVRDGLHCPRKMLLRSEALLLDLPDPAALDNINTPEEFADAERRLRAP